MVRITSVLFLLAGALVAQPQPIASGLRAPHKLVLTPRGNFLVTESSTEINNGRVSFVSRTGARRSFMEGLPSGTEVTGGGSGPTAMVLRDARSLYLAVGAGDVERRGERAGTTVFNPLGGSSPLFSSVLDVRLSADVDNLAGTFVLTPALQQRIADGFEVTLEDGVGTTARISLLLDIPDASPDPNTIFKFSNLWALALSPDGSTLYVSDASGNALIRVDTTTGKWQRITRFPPGQNSTPVGPPVIDAVPTSVRTWGSELLVSTLTGFPFIRAAARVYTVNPTTGAFAPFITFLTSATDVLVLPVAGQRPIFFTLEFSLNQTATPPAPGRLLRYDTAQAVSMSDTLAAPVSMVIDEATKSLFVLSLTGTIIEFKI